MCENNKNYIFIRSRLALRRRVRILNDAPSAASFSLFMRASRVNISTRVTSLRDERGDTIHWLVHRRVSLSLVINHIVHL